MLSLHEHLLLPVSIVFYVSFGSYSVAACTTPDCPAGEYWPGTGGCAPCLTGRYQPIQCKYRETCYGCAAGKYAPAGSSSCISCAVGMYSASPTSSSTAGAGTCTACAAGKYASSPGSAVCDTCPVGSYSPSLSSACIACPAGQYAISTGSAACVDCDAGKYSATSGRSTVCSDVCVPGKYSIAGSSTCTQCEAGTYSTVSGVGACTLCDAGKYSSDVGRSTACSATCVPGEYSLAGSSTCTQCEAGTYSTVSGVGACTLCGAGKYSSDVGRSTACSATCVPGEYSVAGANTCTQCPAGAYSAMGASSCSSCEAGYYQASSGQISCDPCAVGQYQAATGQSMCSDCAAGQFQDSTGSSSCSACSAGKVQPSTSQSACVDCEDGTVQASSGQATCAVCESGKYSGEGLECVECPAGQIAPNAGTKTCDACADGYVTTSPGTTYCYECFHEYTCASKSACAEGYTGNACATCAVAFYLLNDRCIACPTFAKHLWVFAIIFATFVCYLIYIASDKNLDLASVKIMFSHFQLTSVYLSFKLQYPPVLLALARWFGSILSFDVVQLAGIECSTGNLDYGARWALAAFAPLVVMLPFYVIGSKRALRTLATLASITFLYALETCMEVWACTERADGTAYLNAAPALDCKAGTSTYDWLLAGSILLFCLYFFGINMGLVAAEQNIDTAVVSNDFAEDSKLWFLALNFFKWCSLIVNLYMTSSPTAQAVVMLVLLLLMLAAHTFFWPYSSEANNRQDLINYVLQILQLVVSLILYATATDETAADGILCTIFALGISMNAYYFYKSFRSPASSVSKEKDVEMHISQR